MKNFLRIFKKSPKKTVIDESFKESLKDRYLAFQNLLHSNNQVLEIMADLEEKLSGDYLFDRHYIDKNIRLISGEVLKIIECLNSVSKDRYRQLHKSYDAINKEIKNILARKIEIPVSELTIPIENLNKEMSLIAGGKIAHLGEIKNRLNLLTPDGFSITAYAFKRLMEHNKFSEKINKKLSSLAIENMEELDGVSKEIQEMVIGAEIPEDLKNTIKNAVERLKVEKLNVKEAESNYSTFNVQHSTLKVSVRSSAIEEDGELIFAGQYATFLNVPEDLVIKKYKEVVASLFTSRAIFYYKTKGFSEEEMVMAVGVLKMVDAKAGGVIYTKDPIEPEKDTVIINAAWGLGKIVVDGTVEPNSYVVSRKDGSILQKKIVEQPTMLVCSDKGGIEAINVPDETNGIPCLTDDQIKALYNQAMLLENHYGSPQDIEWAVDQKDQIYILQSRPLKMLKVESSKLKVPIRIEKYNILLDKGIIACKGIGFGKAFILKDEEQLKDFPNGAVLVARQASTKFVTVMNKAAAIITDIGCATEHMASISREYHVPTILCTETATSVIKDGQEITVDAIYCNIYEGRVEELIRSTFNVQRSTFRDTNLFRTLEKALKWISPLNLIDPADESFKPEYCKTFHDITRFAHEKAMEEMFGIGTGHEIKDSWTIPLIAGIPIDAHMIDIDGGIKENTKKASPEDILSIPFSAFLKGMLSMRWPEPRAADVKGFIGMMAHTATISEEELYKTGEKSFAIISRNYMNFSIRLGYHFSQIEAYAGEHINNNYIRFFFKGGGSSPDRRLRRVRLIKEILGRMDIKATAREDVINAVLTGYNRAIIEEKLVILGKLTAYTKQLDMVMYNDAVTDWYIEEFVKEHLRYE